jgi:hypothetical protein
MVLFNVEKIRRLGFAFALIIMHGFIALVYSQTKVYLNISHTPVKADVFFPLLSDSLLEEMKNFYNQELLKRRESVSSALLEKMGSFYNVLYPKLVVNNAIISDTAALNCFRNHFDRTKITKIKHISVEKAKKMSISNVPKDGVLFVSTKKGYYFDFSCE